jgi:hypothetical protein
MELILIAIQTLPKKLIANMATMQKSVFQIEGFTASHKQFCPSKNTFARIALHNEILKQK